MTAAVDALAAAYHTLHCRPLFDTDRGHNEVGVELDRTKARFLLAVLAEDGWTLVRNRTTEPPEGHLQ